MPLLHLKVCLPGYAGVYGDEYDKARKNTSLFAGSDLYKNTNFSMAHAHPSPKVVVPIIFLLLVLISKTPPEYTGYWKQK